MTNNPDKVIDSIQYVTPVGVTVPGIKETRHVMTAHQTVDDVTAKEVVGRINSTLGRLRK